MIRVRRLLTPRHDFDTNDRTMTTSTEKLERPKWVHMYLGCEETSAREALVGYLFFKNAIRFVADMRELACLCYHHGRSSKCGISPALLAYTSCGRCSTHDPRAAGKSRTATCIPYCDADYIFSVGSSSHRVWLEALKRHAHCLMSSASAQTTVHLCPTRRLLDKKMNS